MGKLKTTKKEIVKQFNYIICVGYCELANLLALKEALFYTSGAYGWNSDIYLVDGNSVICTGYRPFGNISVNREIINKYEEQAKGILTNRFLTYEEQVKKMNALLEEFIKEIVD